MSLYNMANTLATVPPKRTIMDVDPADREAVKRIRTQTFHAGATIDECLEAYLKHHGLDPAVQSLMQQHERKEATRFRERMEAAAAKTLHEAAGLPEPSPDDEKVKPTWCFADDMDLEEDEEFVEKIDSEVEDLVTGGRMDMSKGKTSITPPQERSGVVKYFPPSTAVARDVFGRAITGVQEFKSPSDSEKTATRFKAQAILKEAFKIHLEEYKRRLIDTRYRTFGKPIPLTFPKVFEKSNPLKFPQVDLEFVDRFGRAPLKFAEAYPATTLDKTIKGCVVRLKSATEDGASKIRLMNVSASPLWSGKAGLHNTPSRTVRSVQLNKLSPEEIHLGDYYHHNFRPVAPHQFVHFPKLPLHVQDLIWEFSFESRIVEIQYTKKFNHIWSPTKWPPQSLACKESNAVMRRVYERSPFGDATARRGLLFNFDIDVLFLTFEKRDLVHIGVNELVPLRAVGQFRVALKFLQSLPAAKLPKIRHLALDLSLWEKLEHDLASLRRRRHKVHGDEKFILPMLTALSSFRIIENHNVGRWRINKQTGVESISHENMVARQCSSEGLGLNDNSVRFDIGELMKGSPAEANSTLPRWWDGSEVMFLKRVVPWLPAGAQ